MSDAKLRKIKLQFEGGEEKQDEGQDPEPEKHVEKEGGQENEAEPLESDEPPKGKVTDVEDKKYEAVEATAVTTNADKDNRAQLDEFLPKIQQTGEALTDADSFATRLTLLRQFSSDYFLNKHSPSFKCFEQYLCSRSDIRVTLYYFPPLVDPGLDDALNYIPPKEVLDANGTDKYIKMCKDLEIVPISRVIRSLSTDTLDLKYYGLSLKQMRGIADALKVNSNIKYLILEDNWMSPEAVSLISDILRENNSIRVLNLRECRIGLEGAEKISEGLASTQFLEELDLSRNSLGDRGLLLLQPSLIENSSIRKINLGHNELSEDSGATLEQILQENKILEELDLEWNGFYTGPGNKKLCNGLQRNEQISWLNLSWNGIGTSQAMRPITKYIRKTESLRFIDLSSNRITQEALRMLKFALVRNKSLERIKIGKNIYTPDEAYFLATLFDAAKNDLTYLDMEDVCVNKDFIQLKKKLQPKGKVITHGHVISNYEIYGPDINKLLFRRCKYLAMKPKKMKQKKDFGHFVLSLPDKPISPQDFQILLKKKKVKKIDKDLLKELLLRFPARKQNVDSVAMKNAYMTLYPDTVLPEEVKKKKKKGKGKKKPKVTTGKKAA